jgi:hypothetical protein
MMRTGSRWILVSGLVSLAVFGVFVLLLWATGLLDIPETGGGDQALAAVVGLLGGLFASSLTFIGVVLKHSLDEQAEGRLQLEASIKAVDLLATAEGKPAPISEQAGALFALAHLGQMELALALLSELWVPDGVSTTAAARLIDQALASGEEEIQLYAATILKAKVALLVHDGFADLPRSVASERSTWPTDLPEATRYALLEALIELLTAQSVSNWDGRQLQQFVYTFDAMRRDPIPGISSAGVILLSLLLSLDEELPDDLVIFAPEGVYTIGDLKKQVEEQVPEASDELDRDLELKIRWLLADIQVLALNQVSPPSGTNKGAANS